MAAAKNKTGMGRNRKSGAPAPGARAPELVITRVFDAPPTLVFQAWVEPEHLVHWSAPWGFTITHCEGDLRPGGAWRSCMRSPAGEDLWLGGVYREIVENERLVFTHAWDGKDGRPGHETVVTVTFTAEGGKTKMIFRQAGFESVEARDGHQGGWTQCFDRLAARLVAPARAAGGMTLALPSDREIVLTRVFDAPRRLVFEAHSKPEHVRRWWGHRGSTLSVCEMDFRPGGAWRFVERQADGREYGFRGVYREIVAPERIVQTFEFEGLPGHVSVETMTLVERDGRTTLTTCSLFETVADRDEMLRSGMEAGAGESLERLAKHVAAMQ
jgi:uncharacterized protein YndB with AHSA1/START domain